MAIDYTTNVGRVRLLVPDTDEDDLLFSDEQISAFLTVEGSSVRRAAAAVLETIASNEAMVSKKIRTLDLQTDGPAVAAELRARAKTLRDQDAADADDPWGLEIAEFDQWAAYR